MKNRFTLIELLVVIAIIGILLTLLLPSLSKARERGYYAVCASNESQIGKGLNLYVMANNQILPGAHVRNYPQTMLWAARIRKDFMGNSYDAFNCPKQLEKSQWKYVSGSGNEQWGYDNNEALINNFNYFSYGANDWGTAGWDHGNLGQKQYGIGGHITGPEHKGWVFYAKIEVPSDFIMLADSEENADWDYIIDGTNSNEHPGFYHLNSTPTLFSDGHVQRESKSSLLSNSEENRRRWNNDNEAHFADTPAIRQD